MDYNKKYKELVEILNKANEDNETKYKTFSCVFDDIMSKIKANEDERIGDEIIHFLTTTHDTRLVGNKKHVDEWVSWIEEQRGKDKLIEELGAWKTKYIQEVLSEKTKGQNKHKFNIGDVITNGKVVYRVDNIVKNAIGQDCYFLVNVEMEKNGRRYLTMSVRGETTYMGETTWLCEQVDKSFEKQREQKPTYMFKPKFHKGDFIKHNKANIICKVISVDCGSYYVENIETNGGIELFNAEQNFHLWSIEDAKDGDVLHSPEHNLLWIYKNKEESHIAVNLNYANSISFGSDIVIPSDVCPATKEQRDLLFSKMKKAGYEWDSEKKKVVRCVIDDGKAEMDYCFTKMMNGEKVSPTCGEEDERIKKALISILKSDFEKDTTIYDISVGDIIAWLEKQDNTTIKWNKNTKDNKPQFNHSVLFMTNYGVVAEGEWNGKEWLRYRWGSGIDDSAVTDWMELSVLKRQGEKKSQGKSALEVWKDMRLEVYQQASGNRHEPNCSDDSTKMFSLNDIDEIFEKVAEKQGEQKPIDKIQLGKKYKCIASPRYSTFRRGNIYKPVDNFLCNLMNLCYECFEPIEDSEQKPTDEDMVEALRTEYEKGRADAFAEMEKEQSENDEKWSEKDENMLLRIKSFIQSPSLDLDKELQIMILDWLDNRYRLIHWKPSKEHLYWLHWLSTNILVNGVVEKKAAEILEDLYNNLRQVKFNIKVE